jgi:hypothetical protein
MYQRYPSMILVCGENAVQEDSNVCGTRRVGNEYRRCNLLTVISCSYVCLVPTSRAHADSDLHTSRIDALLVGDVWEITISENSQ